MPSASQVPTLSPAYMDNSRWLLDHLSELSGDYRDQWVAVCGRKVVAANPDLSVVTAAAAQMSPVEDTVFHFVDGGSLILVLAP